MKKDLLTVTDLSLKEIDELFSLSTELKKNPEKFSSVLARKSVALIFQKPSNRTRVSFEVGVWQLGGQAICLKPDDIDLGVRETIKDIAKTLSRYVHGVMLRTYGQNIVVEFAKYADVPVINGLSDLVHPCQILADLFTIQEKCGALSNVTMSYIGDGNNICHSLMHGAALTGMKLKIGTPKKYIPDKAVVNEALVLAKATKAQIILTNDVKEAVKDSDILYTDVWASMGKEKEAVQRKKVFASFQLNSKVLKMAKPSAKVMHCLPAHRGNEITDEAIDSPQSIVFDQAENRLHVQKAILIKLIGKK